MDIESINARFHNGGITYQRAALARNCRQSVGATSSRTEMAIKLPDKGRVKKADHSPWLMVSAWRIDC
jgi:hypothetical protein